MTGEELVIATLGPDLSAVEWAARLDLDLSTVSRWMREHHGAVQTRRRTAEADGLAVARRALRQVAMVDPADRVAIANARAAARAALATIRGRVG